MGNRLGGREQAYREQPEFRPRRHLGADRGHRARLLRLADHLRHPGGQRRRLARVPRRAFASLGLPLADLVSSELEPATEVAGPPKLAGATVRGDGAVRRFRIAAAEARHPAAKGQPVSLRKAVTMDSTERSMSSLVVLWPQMEMRMAARPCHLVPPTQHTPSSWTPWMTSVVT